MKGLDSFLYLYNFIRPILDIGFLAFILYKTYKIIVKTNSIQIVITAIIVLIAYACAVLFKLETLSWLFNLLAPGLIIAFAIVFQPELRKLFLRLGQNHWVAPSHRSKNESIEAVLTAADYLSKVKRGMLVVFIRHSQMDDHIMRTGTKLNADLSSNLLQTIFEYDSACHDGAVFIQGDKIIAAGCFLPLSERYDIKKSFGTRHRAALGLSEVTDAVILVVSEETGAISLAYDSNLYYDLSAAEITRILGNLLTGSSDSYVKEDILDESK